MVWTDSRLYSFLVLPFLLVTSVCSITCPDEVDRRIPAGANCTANVGYLVNGQPTRSENWAKDVELIPGIDCFPEGTRGFIHHRADGNCTVTVRVRGVCSWYPNHCWPGDCSNDLAANCRCRSGFLRTGNSVTGRRCQLYSTPTLDTCRVAVIGSHGEITNSTNSAGRTSCYSQQGEVMNTQPTQLSFFLKAHVTNDVGSTVSYVKESQVGIVGAKVTVVKVAVSGSETTILEQTLIGPPHCPSRVNAMHPVVKGSFHQCEATLLLPQNLLNLKDGENVCAVMEASAGGYYKLQDYSGNYRGIETFSETERHNRICFMYDETQPAHCTQTGGRCSSQPLKLSARFTRYPEVELHVEGWADPNPPGGSASGIKGFRVEVHDVHVGRTILSVLDNAITNLTKSWNARSYTWLSGGPYDVTVTLPQEAEARLYALILEVQDKAGNVRYARRLVLVDNSSSLELNTSSSLSVVHASPSCNHRWQTDVSKDLCVDWAGRFFNTEMYLNNLLTKIDRDNGRGISDHYDQTTGPLPVNGTDNINGVTKFEIAWSVDQSPRSVFTEVTDLFTQTHCLRQPLRDGETYHVWITASDVMNNTKVDSVSVSIDYSEPELSAEVDSSTETVVINVTDHHSGLVTLNWTLTSTRLEDDAANSSLPVQRLENVTNCNGLDHCYCPSVDDCEIYTYLVPFTTLSQQGKLHGDFNLTITAVNGACLYTTIHLPVVLPQPPSVLPIGYIVGPVVGLLMVTGIIAAFCWRRGKKRRTADGRKEHTSPYPDPYLMYQSSVNPVTSQQSTSASGREGQSTDTDVPVNNTSSQETTPENGTASAPATTSLTRKPTLPPIGPWFNSPYSIPATRILGKGKKLFPIKGKGKKLIKNEALPMNTPQTQGP